MSSEVLWKLPALDLNPAADGGWEVQSEPGLGAAFAVFAPLRRTGPSDWEIALPEDATLDLTPAGDRGWSPLPLPPVAGASDYVCLLRYDHPSDRPGNSFFRLDLKRLGPPAAASQVTGAQLRAALARVQEILGPTLALYVVPAPAAPAPAEPPPPQAAARGFAAGPQEQPTAGVASPASLCFAFASCQYPAGMLDRAVAHQSYARLAAWLAQHPAPERLLLLGDQVYTDASYGLLDPVRLDDRYRMPYEELKDRATGPFAALPQAFLGRRRMTPDDHEIADNWEPDGSTRPDAHYHLGLQAYWAQQRRTTAQGALQIVEQGPGWRLFMADSRTQREFRDEHTVHQASLLGQAQMGQLREWLASAPADQLKIVTTAAMLLPRTRQHIDDPLYLDNWQGYPASFHGLLALLCDLQVRNLALLSGDAHIGCSVQVSVTNLASGAHTAFGSHHAPALYAPYPFANEHPANLLLADDFEFSVQGQVYACRVRGAIVADGASGCALLQAQRQGSEWKVEVEVLAG